MMNMKTIRTTTEERAASGNWRGRYLDDRDDLIAKLERLRAGSREEQAVIMTRFAAGEAGKP